MLISHKKKFIFIHIFKTAGTSVTDFFVPYARFKDRLAHQYWLSRKTINGINRLFVISDQGSRWFTGFHKHASAQEIKNQLNKEVFQTYLKFTFVRNPYDWLFSYYAYIQQSSYHPLHKTMNKIVFNEFIERFILDNRLKTQSSFLLDQEGKLLTDYIGKLEHLNEDLKTLCTNLDLPFKSPSRINITQTPNKNLEKSINQENIKLINNYFQEDFELFNYNML